MFLKVPAIYTGSRLLQIRLLPATSYNEHIFFSRMNASHWHQCSKSLDTMSTGYKEHIFMN